MGRANATLALADLYTHTGRTHQAEAAYESARRIYVERGARFGEASALDGLAELYDCLDRGDEADAARESAAALLRAAGIHERRGRSG